jgi:flagellar hook protein FlgE
MQFPSNGGNPTAPSGPVAIDIPAGTRPGGGATLPINGIQLNLGSATQYGASFGVTDLSQSGYAPGQLSGIQIEGNGVIMARYSNGQSKPAGQLELANFRNPQGLQPVGGNAWASSFKSGDPVVGAAGDGNFGVLQSGSLEESNTDLTGEQANAQTIKTQDAVLQTLVNLR